jgi:hypothetical protein
VILSQRLRLPTALLLLSVAWPNLARASARANVLQWPWWSLPILLALAIGGHVVLGRGAKALLAAGQPLCEAAPEIASYERRVYGTADWRMHEVVALVLVSGVVAWVAILMSSWWLGTLSSVLLLGAIGLDVWRWQRVTVSANDLFFQRGWRQKVHRVSLAKIRIIEVSEASAPGWTLRHGPRNRLCRLTIRLSDKRQLALPKTDAKSELDAVEGVANHVRQRLTLSRKEDRKDVNEAIDTGPDTIAGSHIATTTRNHTSPLV